MRRLFRVEGWRAMSISRRAMPVLLLALMIGVTSAQPTGVMPPRSRITAANAETLSLYMVGAKRAERVLWSPGGSTLAVMDGTDIDLYSVTDWLLAPVKIRLDQTPNDLAFSPNGQTLYVAVPGSVIGFATMGGGQVESHLIDARRIALSPDGALLAWVARSGALEIYNLTERASFQLAPAADDVSFTPDGRRVAARLADGSALMFDLITRQSESAYVADVTEAAMNDVPLHGVLVTGDGRTLMLPAGNGAALAAFSVRQPEADAALLTLSAPYTRVYGWGVNPRARLVVGAAIAQTPQQSAILVWDMAGGPPLTTLKHPGVRDAALSPDGTLIASVGGGTLRLWALAESLPTAEQARNLSATNVVAACDVYGGRPTLGAILDGQTMSLVWSWYASTPQQVRDYLDAALFQLELDGQPVRPWVFVSQTAPDPVNEGNPTVYFYAPVGVLTFGNHVSAVQVTWVRTINDGFADFGPGTAAESDGGTCQFGVS